MSGDRERILQRVRAALLAERPMADSAASPPAPTSTAPHAELLTRFGERLRAVAGRCVTADDGGLATVLAALRGANARTVALGEGALVDALAPALTAAGFTCLAAAAATAALFEADAGLTTAQWGVAETGSIVLDSDHGLARRASLVPPLHLVLLPRARMVEDLDALWAKIPRPVPTAWTLITGPSRTADIELQLVIGVHGPRDLVVVLT